MAAVAVPARCHVRSTCGAADRIELGGADGELPERLAAEEVLDVGAALVGDVGQVELEAEVGVLGQVAVRGVVVEERPERAPQHRAVAHQPPYGAGPSFDPPPQRPGLGPALDRWSPGNTRCPDTRGGRA